MLILPPEPRPKEVRRPVTYGGILWENYYVSNYGIIYRDDKPRKVAYDKFGYALVSLTANGRRATAPVHHVVAEAFLGPRPPQHEVHHKDTTKAHNWPWNLEYIHMDDHQTHGDHKIKRGEEVWRSKLTKETVAEAWRLKNEGVSGAEIGRRLGVTRQTICDLFKGRTWKEPV